MYSEITSTPLYVPFHSNNLFLFFLYLFLTAIDRNHEQFTVTDIIRTSYNTTNHVHDSFAYVQFAETIFLNHYTYMRLSYLSRTAKKIIQFQNKYFIFSSYLKIYFF